ncbi:hypothetical protein [Longitalea luteola]|uniref:hypothetical protein n=1 Tax=Longitalea luteola TaxID=2812563 RepID=UPI001A96C70E|nr:hypothetical protein [Longitalea luteola]
MKLFTKYQKQFAAFLLLVMTLEMIIPATVYGLTSGPSQPEMKGFEPVGNSDMVDLFTGDFTYNIPLLDVGGYPVNLAYHSGSGMDEEASWVGLGWSLNTGSVNRQLRGLPDDFNGADKQERELSMKEHITTAGKFAVTLDLLGFPVNKVKKKRKKKKLNLSLTLSAGVKIDNYRGVGAEIGANVGTTLTDFVAGELTQKKEDSATGNRMGLSVGLNLNSMDGATVPINARIINNHLINKDKGQSISSSVGFGYNSRAGLAGMTLGGSFRAYNVIRDEKNLTASNVTTRNWQGGSFISFNGDTYTPTINHSFKNTSFTLSVSVGGELFFAYLGNGVQGLYSKQEVAHPYKQSSAYGYLNSEKGINNNDALMDFNREKDIAYNNQIKYLPIPIPTYDLFSASSQDGGGQYRLYRGSSGVFFDQRSGNTANEFKLGLEVGGGALFDVGADLYFQNIETKTLKWKDRNNFLSKGDFMGHSPLTPLYEPAYFKRVGEPVPYDNGYVNKIKGTEPVAVHLPARISNAIEGPEASELLRTKYAPSGESTQVLKRDKREVRNTTFSYLTAAEATNHALDKTIKDHHPDSLVLNNCSSGGIRNSFARIGGYRKANHFSEITITGDDGKRSVFGIPVYNTYQEEVSFSIDQNLSLRNKGLINYNDGNENSTSNSKGLERYYTKEKTPSYATSYLLTAILSPDYIDRTSNGVTDDDLGTAVKFNYSRLNDLYNWRTPFAFGQDTANYNEGFLSDARDDKANYVYGQKEIWYLHSIESKTMVAHFILGNRGDALGVQNSRGLVDTTRKLKYLKEIRLYSKSDLRLNNDNPATTIPIKVVHFEYDYSLIKGLPNSIGNTGKLTLKKVYFTFGVNEKGRLNPYEFKYDTSFNRYDYRQYDRWGTYKKATDNPNGLNNSEFPYTLQDTGLTNAYASAWQLNEIILPSGGKIHVTYESDDYGWVQDRRASQVCMFQGVNTSGSSAGLIDADYIYITLPKTVSSRDEMLERYFEGIENLYYKCYLDLDNKDHNEYVPGYAKIIGTPELIGNNIAKVQIEKKGGVNTIARSGWQYLRTNLPKYAYPGSDNFEDNGSDLKKTIKALVAAFGTIKELINGFNSRAKRYKYADSIDLGKSWVRLCSPEWKKIGGGSRVKRIDISDDWAAMSGATGAKTATYSQVYDYSTMDSKGRTISSGVASYEPLIGNDENPFRQPIRYKQKEFLALDNYYYIEEPFGESFFPAASVGYSKVTVRSVGSGDAETVNRTGVTVSEFYTARDYPTKVNVMGLQQRKPGTGKLFKLLSNKEVENIGLSQGYSIELNDMHGKQKAMKVFNKSGENISSIEYFYQSENELTEKKTLRNNVKVIASNGIVSDGTIGMDVEMFTDMRQQTTDNLGISAKVSGGSGSIIIFPLPFFFPGIGVNYDRRCYRAASTIKIVQRFAIQYKTRKMENGSSLTAENLLWDAETGNVLLTKTQNEFDDAVYSMLYPAHWVYNGMGQAYRNLGTIFSGFSTNSNGEITNSVYNAVLAPGDELIDVNASTKYWVVNSPISSVYSNRLIDKDGNLQQISNRTLKVLRSGRKNMASAAIASISSLNNPIVGDRLQVTQLTSVLDAKAAVFSEEWSVPIMSNCNQPACPQGCALSGDSTYCYSVDEHYPEPPTASDFDSICLRAHGAYGSHGTYIYSAYNTNGTYSTTPPTPPVQIDPNNLFWINPNGGALGPLNRCGIWQCGSTGPGTTWVGFTTRINVPVTKTYYIGIGGDNQAEIVVDGTTIVRQSRTAIRAQGGVWFNTDPTFRMWHIFPVSLDSGQRTIQLRGWNIDSTSDVSFGAEIYNNTDHEISNATSYNDLNIVFSSKDFINRAFNHGQYTSYNCPSGYTLDSTGGVFICRDTTVCQVSYGTNTIVNPFYTGILGNWRPKSQFAYQVSRENLVGNTALLGSTNIRKSGAYSVFNPFWQYNYTTLAWQNNPTLDQHWIAANEITYINSKGLEIENRDALNRYSAAVFGYLESLPVAVASNAQYREVAYDGFEDYGFTLDCGQVDTCNTGHFNFKKYINGSSIALSGEQAHSGKYSLKLTTAVTVNKTVFVEAGSPLFSFDNGRYSLQSNELAKGFSPVPGKRYVLSFWVKDGSSRDATTSVQAIVNGTNLVNSSVKWPIVEGWKRVEVPFVLPSVSAAFSLQLQGSGTIYLDDIRVHPFDAQLKTFAYDPSSQRVWAELDENNFATYYEYDDEGVLVRVKKETERGIMTIKETRSSFRKRS